MNNEYTRVFKALSDPKRVRILEILCKSEECACVLLDDLNVSQPTLSHHMKILCDSGLVTGRKQGRWMYYSINGEGCEYANHLLNKLKDGHMDDVIKISVRCNWILHPVMSRRIWRTEKATEIPQTQRHSCCCCRKS